MPPKRIPANVKKPDFIKARISSNKLKAGGATELDDLWKMSTAELFPYICFLSFVILTILYNVLPSLFRHLVEFQYPTVIEKEDDNSIPQYGERRRSSLQTYGVGMLDIPQLTYLFLAVVSIQIFVAELLQAAAKYLLRSPKKIQESFVIHGVYLIYTTFALSSAFSLISEDIFTFDGLWASTGKPISRTFKFFILSEIAAQISFLVTYFLHTPQKNWNLLAIGGNALGVIVTFLAYFSGYFVPTLLILTLFDVSSWIKELALVANAVFYQKKESFGKQLKVPFTLTWIFSRVVSIFLVVVNFWIVSPNQPQGEEAQSELPSKFKLHDLILLGTLVLLVGIQLKWLPDATRKIVQKPKTA